MKILITSTPATGLFNPLLAIGRILIAAGHEVAGVTGSGSCDKRPSPETLREAIRTVLDKPNYRARASLMAEEFAAIDTRSEILRTIAGCMSKWGYGDGSILFKIWRNHVGHVHVSPSVQNARPPTLSPRRPGEANRVYSRVALM